MWMYADMCLDYFPASIRSLRVFPRAKGELRAFEKRTLIALFALRLRTAIPDCKREMNQHLEYNKSKANPGGTGHDIQLWAQLFATILSFEILKIPHYCGTQRMMVQQ